MKVITDYNYVYNVIYYDYNYFAFGDYTYDYDCDYLKSCNQSQLITITPSLFAISVALEDDSS